MWWHVAYLGLTSHCFYVNLEFTGLTVVAFLDLHAIYAATDRAASGSLAGTWCNAVCLLNDVNKMAPSKDQYLDNNSQEQDQ